MPLTSRIVTTVLVLLLGGLVLACDLIDPSDEVATAKLYVDPGPDPSRQDLVASQAALARYAAETESRPVMQAIIGRLSLDEATASLSERISATASEDEQVLTIEVRDDDPEAARLLALALGDEMIRRSFDAQVEPEPIEAIPAQGIHEGVRELEERIRERFEDDPDRTERPVMVRHRLVWLEKPAVPARSSPDA